MDLLIQVKIFLTRINTGKVTVQGRERTVPHRTVPDRERTEPHRSKNY